MAAKTGTPVNTKLGLPGTVRPVTAVMVHDAALSTSNTYTIADLFPKPVLIHGVTISGTAMDTNTAPQLAITVGNSDDADGFLKSVVISQKNPYNVFGADGALINTVISNPDVTMTVAANPATGASSGTWYFTFWAEAVNHA